MRRSHSHAIKLFARFIKPIARRNILVRKGVCRNNSYCPDTVREVSFSHFLCLELLRVKLQSPKSKYGFCDRLLYAHKRQNGFQNNFGFGVGSLKAIQRAPFRKIGFFWVVPAAQGFCQEFYRGFINHAHLDSRMVSWRSASLAAVCFRSFYANVRLPVDQTSEIGECSLVFRHLVPHASVARVA